MKDSEGKKKIKALVEEIPIEEKPKEEKAINEVSSEQKSLEEGESNKKTQNTSSQAASIGVAETQNVAPEPPKKERSKFWLFFFITLGITVLIAFLAGGFFVYYSGVRNLNSLATTVSQPSVSSEPTINPEATPTPTSAPVNNKKLSEYKVSVLNGSGIIGAATEVKNILEKGGFKVANTGNADNFNYKETVIAAKSSVTKDVITTLESLLDKSYNLKIDEKSLKETSSYDLVISVGLKQ